MHRITSTQPQVTDQKIYGSVPNKPMEGAANQPEVLPNTTVHGIRKNPTINVRLKASDTEAVINAEDYDADRHERLE